MSKLDKLIYPFALILGIIMFFIPGYDVHISFVFWIGLMLYCFCNIEKRMLLMLFAFTVFVFGMSRIVIPAYYTNDYIENSILYSMSFGQDVHNFIARASFLSLVSALIGFNIVRSESVSDYKMSVDYDSVQMKKIRMISKYMYLLSSILVIYSIYTRFSFVSAFGYMDSYISYSDNLPILLSKFASTNALSLYLFFATMPSKKEAKFILMIFIAISLFSLLTGGRTKFVMDFITLLLYFVLRNRLDPSNPWLTKKGKIVILSLLPTLVALMFVVMLVRGESSFDDFSFFDMIINSIYQQGSIIEVLGISYEQSGNIPERLWSFGRIIESYNNNFLFQVFNCGQEYKANTAEFAIHGHSLANYLTYSFQTQRFLAGGGMGSSFIAESWLDFGNIGIVGFSFIYGIILAKFYLWSKKNVWIFSISFYMVNAIIYSPRAGAIDFISDILSPTYLLFLFFIYIFSKIKFHA